MLRRLTIGLRFSQREAWVGGVYYVRNLVCALCLLPPRQRPRLLVVGADKAALNALKDATGYPGLERVSRTRLHRAPARLLPLGRPEPEIDLILLDSPPGLEDRSVLWIPDLQEHAYPEFFAEEELAGRLARQGERLALHRHVMVSSHAVAGELRRRYPVPKPDIHVVRFASFFEPPADPAAVRARYGMPERYFVCSNQVWKHKNHAVVLRALAALGPDAGAAVVFTGQEEEPRDPAYPASVWALADELGVQARTRRLGFIPRADQLALMAGALAVVQPSLSEGWSTVVEDAKALGRHVLASDISVHREQLERNADFFDPADAGALAGLLQRCAESPPAPQPIDYAAARRRFAQDLWEMIVSVRRDLRRRRTPRLVIRR